MNAKVRWMIDLWGIYIKKGVTSEKTPTRIPAKSLVIGSMSHSRK